MLEMNENPSFENVKELESLSIKVIADNETDPLSSSATDFGTITNEIQRAIIGHKEELDISEFCCAAHGFSILLARTLDGESHTILFDAGPYGKIFTENARKLDIDYEEIEAVVYHSGGLTSATSEIARSRLQSNLSPPLLDLPSSRPSRRGIRSHSSNDHIMVMNNPTLDELESAGGQVLSSSIPHTICSNFYFISGEIPRHTSYELGMKNHLSYDEASKQWNEDPWIWDERFLVARVKGKGLVVITGCGHAGIVNTLLHAQQPVKNKEENCEMEGNVKYPIYLALGGFHLAGRDFEPRIQETVRDLKSLINPAYLIPAHCSGWRFKAALEHQVIGEEKAEIEGNKKIDVNNTISNNNGNGAFAGRVIASGVGKIFNITGVGKVF
ncbi:5391_t:CDS:2 [Acaulospora colombiana]|uniref:5391_t:CDS:1 n=1 Tax=Acaulospora colombiana TaxID=27376 RepID=A0ACA9K3U0_9GLOM|nr:5391_t:CDS:2 [Acaulospora colombiana]